MSMYIIRRQNREEFCAIIIRAGKSKYKMKKSISGDRKLTLMIAHKWAPAVITITFKSTGEAGSLLGKLKRFFVDSIPCTITRID